MSERTPRKRLLDPVDRASEILFGIIMVLSFTGSIAVASAGREDVREVLVGAIGCNLAWGFVDAVMYLMQIVLERRRVRSLAFALRTGTDPASGRRLLAEALPEPLDRLDDEALEGLRHRLSALPELPDRALLARADLGGALGVFLIVSLCTFPVIVPFLFVQPLALALRASNGIALAMLYAAGHVVGRHAGFGPLRTGLAMAAIGVVLVAVTMALGG